MGLYKASYIIKKEVINLQINSFSQDFIILQLNMKGERRNSQRGANAFYSCSNIFSIR
uniref:Uncharacterized protein n=1 Tax=Anguilla anguilla TaxID=7936 RepID=A0A0E9WDS4_ANGAN